MGTFSGEESDGEASGGDFALMVSSNGQGVVDLTYDILQDDGFIVTNFPVAGDGSFSFVTPEGSTLNGTFGAGTVSGTYTHEDSEGIAGTFSGTIKSSTGIQQANTGYYSGTYGGALAGNIYALLAADGTLFFYTLSSTDADGAGTGTVNAGNSFSGTSFGGLTVTGTLDPTTQVIAGSYSSGGTPLGTFSMSLNPSP